MNEVSLDRLFNVRLAFDHPVTVGITVGLIVAIVAAPVLLGAALALRRVDRDRRVELWKRYATWVVLVPLLGGPILLGAAATILGVAVLSLLCYREYARATGLFRERLISAVVVLGIVLVTFAVADHWYGLFAALTPLGVAAIVVVGLVGDRPRGYIQRVALGTLGFLLFGVCFGHLAYMANDADYRPLMLTVLLCVEANDIFAYLCGKTFGRRQLAPNTSPDKTLGGSLGALVLTTALYAVIGHFLFEGHALASVGALAALGVTISVAGQFGDLMLSSIKRDLGIKDIGAALPGHGGLLDRFDSLILVAPAVFHFVGYYQGFGIDEPTRIMTGG